jgi:hypothetical protein
VPMMSPTWKGSPSGSSLDSGDSDMAAISGRIGGSIMTRGAASIEV